MSEGDRPAHNSAPPTSAPHTGAPGEHHELEEYAGGSIQAWMGHIPIWLLAVYFVLFVWGLYYSYNFWGGLGPGRIG